MTASTAEPPATTSTMGEHMPQTIGFIGSGAIGTALARLAIAAGFDVVLSNSRGPETLADLVEELGEHARAATVSEAAYAADFVVATVPMHAYDKLPAEALAGKIVLDTLNYYPDRDGRIPELDSGEFTTSGLLQHQLPNSHVVKAFNSIGARQLFSLARARGAADRSALRSQATTAERRKRPPVSWTPWAGMQWTPVPSPKAGEASPIAQCSASPTSKRPRTG
ncbi:NAD(P)-binding domain-containing protein [Streptomyces sp. 7G]|uniref:NADPH-dependent F420 reductase n=1 Tax=Streptomyces sp. 7G TaxID=2877241 RepID=UPI0027E1A9A4|nr:NAD(P)-binding domain-containing protein [Streptomyces sp. 7G]